MNLTQCSGLPGGTMIRKSTHEQDAFPLRDNHLKVLIYRIYEQRFFLHKQSRSVSRQMILCPSLIEN